MTFQLLFVQFISSSALVADLPSFGKELLTLSTDSLYITAIGHFSYFPFWFLGQDLRTDCPSS